MKSLIGLAGRSGVGKDYVALVMRQFGYSAYALADDIKLDIAMMEGVPIEQQYGKRDPDIRALQVHYGEAVRAELGEDFWMRRLLFKIQQEQLRGRGQYVVIPDVRKQLEVDAITAAGGVVYGVRAPERVGSNGTTDEQRDAEDEIDALLNLHGFIDNSGTAAASLETQVRGLLGFGAADSTLSMPFRVGI